MSGCAFSADAARENPNFAAPEKWWSPHLAADRIVHEKGRRIESTAYPRARDRSEPRCNSFGRRSWKDRTLMGPEQLTGTRIDSQADIDGVCECID